MPSTKKLLQAAAGSAGDDPLYVEDVFSTYLYAGTGSTQTITNGIDLAGEGGLVWGKSRDNPLSNMLIDTVRGGDKGLVSDASSAEYNNSSMVTSFNSDGFTLGSYFGINYNGSTNVSWSFRKAEKFFDVVTYTGNSTVGRTVAHNLGVAPAWMVIKCTNAARNWCTYHVSLGNGYQIILNGTAAKESTALWNSTTPTATEFTLGNDADVNGTGNTYVAYLFASDAGGFGDDEDENIIKCGSYTTDSGGESSDINVGFEPQWVIAKQSNAAGNGWFIMDSMRGFTTSSGGTKTLQAQSSSAEGQHNFVITSNGFRDAGVIAVNATVIYIAIRRPMKTPEAGTEVFATDTKGSTGTGVAPSYRSPWPVDMQFSRNRTYAGGNTGLGTRMLQGTQMFTDLTNAEGSNASMMFDYMNGVYTDTGTNTSQSAWMFKRAPGFFDVVAYTGNGVEGVARAHNLTVAPELVIVKSRSLVSAWFVLSTSLGKFQYLNLADPFSTTDLPYAFGNGSSYVAPTATNFTVASSINGNTSTYIAYLFATLAGVSKVGTYTGTAGNLNVDCGFSSGARFILIKRTDSSGGWHYWDSLRGITAAGTNDPYLLLNSTAAEVTNTDYIALLSSGFTVTSSAPAALNASGGTYLFLAIS